MTEIERLYFQISNREYVQEMLGKDVWVQVSGHCNLNSADAGFWAAVIPKDELDAVFEKCEWDCTVGTQAPGFICAGSNASYQRLPTEFVSCENIVNYRDFFGVKPEYVELVDEFKLLNNLFYDAQEDKYYAISNSGESIEVARIENRTCAFVKLQYLMRYATARQMALLLFYDIRVEIRGSLKDNSLSEFHEEYKDDSIYYEIWGSELAGIEATVYSVLRGKKVFLPRPVEECGYWPYEKEKKYEEYIIGIDQFGEPIRYTSNPDMLSNYFGANPGAPHYLTPVFFKKEVLQRYYMHPELFSVRDGYLDCKSLWGMEIDNHHVDDVSVYLGDLGRDLPEEEQKHWLQYNVCTSEKLSRVSFQRDFLCISAPSDMPDLQFLSEFSRIKKKWRSYFSWDLFLPFYADDEYNIKTLRIPTTESQAEFDNQVLSLVKTIIDSLNEKEIVKQLDDKNDLKGSISKLERWFSERKICEYEPQIKFLRNLQELRSSGTGHRKGSGYEKIRSTFGVCDGKNKDAFCAILDSAKSFLVFLEENAEQLAAKNI